MSQTEKTPPAQDVRQSDSSKLLCRYWGHKEVERWPGNMFVCDMLRCGRCGRKLPETSEFKYGLLRHWFMIALWRTKRQFWFWYCDYRRWKTRNEPPPF